jgi:predicted cupin superfamily sugar epimerase
MIEKNKAELIKKFELKEHPEGGYFKEVYLSDISIGEYKSSSVIYFLLEQNNFSGFHKIKFDEIWSFNYGSPLTVVEISEDGNLKETTLGIDTFVYVVKGGTIFASYVKDGFSLVSCIVSPSFDYQDFYLYKRDELLNMFPKHASKITLLTRI